MNRTDISRIYESYKQTKRESSGISPDEKRMINNAIHSSPILTGNKKVAQPGQGLTELSNVLSEIGFSYNGDTNLPDITRSNTDHYSVMFSLARKDPNNKDPFTPDTPVDGNARIKFIYTKMFRTEHALDYDRPDRVYEIVAYLTI